MTIPGSRRGGAWIAVLAGGAALGLAFPPAGLAPLAWIGLVPGGLWLAGGDGASRTTGQGFRFGYATGFVFFLAGLHWIALLSKVAVTVSWIMYPSWVIAAAYLALYPALAGAATAFARRRVGIPVAVGWPLFWLAAEWLRAQGELGFPWLHLGYSQVGVLPVLQLAALGGVSAVGAWVALVNGLVLIVLATLGRGRERQRPLALAALGLVSAAPFLLLGPGIPALERPGPPVALVQGNVPGAIKWSGKSEEQVLGKFLLLSHQAVDRGARFILWPETSTGSYLRQNLVRRVRLQDWVDSTDVAVLAGYPDYQFIDAARYRSWNAAGVFWPGTGLGPQYAKIHLVPFGERMPFQSVLPILGRFDMGQAEWTAGTDPAPLPTPLGPAGVLVCFEAIFTDPARQQVLRGATWLVNITNDEWFGESAALQQHAAMAVFRAVELGVPMARVANTGLSFFVDPYGRVVDAGPVFADHVVVAPLAGRPRDRTPFTRTGDLVGPVSALLALAALALAAFSRPPLTAPGSADTLPTSAARTPFRRRPR